MASGTVRGAMAAVVGDEKLTKSHRSDQMKSHGDAVLKKIVEEKQMQSFDEFATTLISNINLIFTGLPRNVTSLSSKRSRCWSAFHSLRQNVLAGIWLKFYGNLGLEANSLFAECVNQELFQQLLVTFFSEQCKPAPTKSSAITLTADQLNAMRYACGYVPHLLLKKYKTRAGMKVERFVQSLEKMAIQGESDSDFHAYTKIWMEKVNRGGLFPLDDKHFEFFIAVETQVQVLLPKHIRAADSETDVKSVIDAVVEDEDVQFYWTIASQDIDIEEDAEELLVELVQKWVTVRGFAIAASWLESYKKAHETLTEKSTSLRKHLS